MQNYNTSGNHGELLKHTPEEAVKGQSNHREVPVNVNTSSEIGLNGTLTLKQEITYQYQSTERHYKRGYEANYTKRSDHCFWHIQNWSTNLWDRWH